MGLHVGIDLGTTFSAVAYYDKKQNKPVIIKNRYNNAVTPSVLCFHNGEILFGEDAKELQALGEGESVAFFKRDMGNPNYSVKLGEKSYFAEDLAAVFLTMLVKDTELVLGMQISSAVITVPAYFNNHQREATIRAGEKAGLKVLRIINEPTAAALAYGLAGGRDNMTVMVYDLGGGTFDVTVVKITADNIEVLGTDGNHQLGGKNWDDMIAIYVAQRFNDEFNVDIFDEAEDYYELLVKVEQAKKQLTAMEKTGITITCRGQKATYELTRDKFNELTRDLMERTEMLSSSLLDDIGLSWHDLDGVLLVGGSTRMKMVSDFVYEMSGKEPLTGIMVDEAVALGAAIQAEMDMNAGGDDNPVLFTIGGKKITDVTAHSLGMVAVSEDRSRFINSVLIPKNTAIPRSNTKPFRINPRYCPNKETEVYILQGESELPLDCAILGKYIISGLDTAEKKETILDITYNYDLNGVVRVSAVQRNISKELTVRVEPVPGDMSWLNLLPDSVARGKVKPATIILAVDLSGSMSGHPLEEAKKAARELVDNLDLTNTGVGLIVFADTNRLVAAPTQNIKAIYRGIDSMSINDVGYGNSDEPFSTALSILKNIKHKRYIIVLTDGVWSYQKEAVRKAAACKKDEIEIIAIGFGSADREFLQKIASADENALFTSLDKLAESFSSIAQVITETGSGSLKIL